MSSRFLLSAAALLIATGAASRIARAGDVVVVATPSPVCTYTYNVFSPYPYGVVVTTSGYRTCPVPYAAVQVAYRYAWNTTWLYPSHAYAYRPAYAYAYTHPYYAYPPLVAGGVAYGPAGAAAWGPYGGFAATTGTRVYSNGENWNAYRAGAAYNPWTGTGGAQRSQAFYDANTGTRGVGQQGGAFNAYTGDYAYGERGAAYNSNTGAAAAGSHGTVGNAATGNQAQVGRGVVYNPNTGQAVRAGGVKGQNGGAVRVNDSVFVNRNGTVQKVTPARRPSSGARRAPKR